MKKLAVLSLLAALLAFNTGCEQQTYEETKMFNQQSTATPHGHGGHAGESHDAAAKTGTEAHPAPKH